MLTSKEHDHGHGHGHGREEGHGHSRELDIEEEEMVLHRNDFKSAAQATTVSHSSAVIVGWARILTWCGRVITSTNTTSPSPLAPGETLACWASSSTLLAMRSTT